MVMARTTAVEPLKVEKENRCNKIRTQWKEFLLEFMNNTSLHGCRIICSQRPVTFRILWLVTLCIMTGSLFFSVNTLYKEYYKYSVVTHTTKEVRHEIPFPTITVCNRNTFNRSSRNLTSTELRYLQREGYLKQHFPTIDWDGVDGMELDQIDYPSFWEQGSFKSELMLLYAEFKGKNLNAHPVVLEYGRFCYTFSSPTVGSDSGLDNVSHPDDALGLVVNVHQKQYVPGMSYDAGILVYMHDAKYGHILDGTVFGVGVGSSVTISLQSKEITFLGSPYNSKGTDCLDVTSPSFVNPLQWFKYYSRGGCLVECRNKYAMKTCNCSAGWQPREIVVNMRNCSIKQVVQCYKTQYNKAASFPGCSCIPSCKMVTYDTQLSGQAFPAESLSEVHLWYDVNGPGTVPLDHLRKNALLLHIKYGSMVVDSAVHAPELVIDDIFPLLGGKMGFFLGASIITMIEGFEFIISLMYKALLLFRK